MCNVPPSKPTATLPAITPTKISIKATEMPVADRDQTGDEGQAHPDRLDKPNVFEHKKLLPTGRSHYLTRFSALQAGRQTPLPRWTLPHRYFGSTKRFGVNIGADLRAPQATAHAYLQKPASGIREKRFVSPASFRFSQRHGATADCRYESAK